MSSRSKKYDIVSLGECMIEFTQRGKGLWDARYGGDALNPLVYATRLGARCGFITCTGDDMFQLRLLRAWKNEKIDLACAKQLHDRQNGLYFIHTDSKGERRFQYYRKNSAATQIVNEIPAKKIIAYAVRSEIFFFSAITLAILERRERLVAILNHLHGKTTIAFDTNYRPALWRSEHEYRNAVKQVLPYVNIILPTDTDERILHPALDAKDVPAFYSEKNITCALKSGRRGAFIDGGKIVPAKKIKMLDTTGAGDTFNAGFLTGILRGYTIEAAAKLGNELARIVIRHRGAIVGEKIFLDELKRQKKV